MTWFRTDDGFYSHPKVVGIPRSVRAEAIGTWTLCGTWSADKELDGYVPEHMVEEMGGTLAGAEALVGARLWRRRRGGFVFVNWAEYQFTREQNESRRETERTRKAKQRARNPRNDAAELEDVPAGHSGVPNTPSPSPSPQLKTDVNGSSSVPSTGAADDDRSKPGEGMTPDLARIAAKLTALAGAEVHPLQAGDVARHVLDKKRGAPPHSATAYVLSSITRDPEVFRNYVNSGRWSE